MKTFYRSTRIAAVVVLSVALFAGLLTQLNRTVQAATTSELDVCATCTYTEIQTAVNAANSGDTIRVVQGTYTGVMNTSELTATVVLTKDLVLLGGFNDDFSQRDPDNYVTTIDTEGNLWGGVLIFGSQAEVDGFHIVNAYGGGVAVANNEDVTAVGTITHNRIAHNRIVAETQLSIGGAGIDVIDGAVAMIAYNEIVSNTVEREYSYGGGIRVVDSTAEINGNIIANNLTYADTVGGGIDVYRSTVTIHDNNVHHNANVGIGIYESVAEVMSNTIDSNTTIYDGGGLDINNGSIFTLTANAIGQNQTQFYDGGGVAIGGQSSGVILDNEFVANEAVNGGGGMYINGDLGNEPLLIEGNIFHGNISEYGAALLVSNTNGEVTISRNDIRFNQVTGEDYQAGGIYISDVSERVSVINNVVANNENRGVKGVNYTEIELINNTLVNNGTIAVEMHAWPNQATVPMTTTVVNNIIDSHPDCAFYGFNNAVFAVHYNDVVGHDLDDCGATIVSQSSNINADPMFVDASIGNYYLQVGSPAVDIGFGGAGIPDEDIYGISRPQGAGFDMGAYETVFNYVFLPIVMKPVETSNVAFGKAVQITTNGANDPYLGSGLSPADVTDGSLEYKAVSSSEEDGVIGFVNNDYSQEMEVTVTIDLGGAYDITSIRYNQGNVQFANYWHPDWMITPFQTTATVPGAPYSGAWTEHTGQTTLSSVTVTFKTTRDSFYEDWFFIGEIEVYGKPAT